MKTHMFFALLAVFFLTACASNEHKVSKAQSQEPVEFTKYEGFSREYGRQ